MLQVAGFFVQDIPDWIGWLKCVLHNFLICCCAHLFGFAACLYLHALAACGAIRLSVQVLVLHLLWLQYAVEGEWCFFVLVC